MINRFSHQGIEWVDLENPTAEEIDQITQEFSLGAGVSEDLRTPSNKPRVDLYPNLAYAILYFPAVRHSRGRTQNYEVDFVIGDNFLITAHYDTVPAVYEFTRSFEEDSLLKRGGKSGFKSGAILLELAEHLYNSVEHELEALEDTINAIENEIFSGHEKEMVVAISAASRELLNQKRSLSNHAAILDTLEQISIFTFGEEYGNYIRGMKLFHGRVLSHAMSLTETINELRETNLALLSTRQNEVMKTLTVMTFVTAPLAVIASLFGMNTDSIPLVSDPNGFWYIVSGMAVIALCFFIYFKIKKWF